jgi:hypothetical protein
MNIEKHIKTYMLNTCVFNVSPGNQCSPITFCVVESILNVNPPPHICHPLAPCHLKQVQHHPVSIAIPEICLFTYSTWAEARQLKKICPEILEKEINCVPPKIRTMHFYILYTTFMSFCIYFRLSLGRELPSEQKRHTYMNF